MKIIFFFGILLVSFCSMADEVQKLKNHDCDVLGFSNPESLAHWKMKNGSELVVCPLFDTEQVGKDQFRGWVNLYQNKNGKLVPFIEDVNSEMPSNYESFTIRKINDSEVTLTRNLNRPKDETGDPYPPMSQQTLDCSQKSCELKKVKCMPVQKIKIDRPALLIAQKVANGKMKPADIDDYEHIVDRLVYTALRGQREAQSFLMKVSPERLHVDGAIGESYNDGLRVIQEMKKLKCI